MLFKDNEGGIFFRGNTAYDDLGILAATSRDQNTETGGGGGVICSPDDSVKFEGNKGSIVLITTLQRQRRKHPNERILSCSR